MGQAEFAPPIAPAADTGEEQLLEIIGQLGAALTQSSKADNPLIIKHVRTGHQIATVLHRAPPPKWETRDA